METLVKKVVIVEGYGEEKATKKEQQEFLNKLKDILLRFGLPTDSIVSERTTGGPITIDVPGYLEPNEITRAFLSLATVLSQEASREEGEEIHVSFGLRLPGCSEPLTILGTGV